MDLVLSLHLVSHVWGICHDENTVLLCGAYVMMKIPFSCAYLTNGKVQCKP